MASSTQCLYFHNEIPYKKGTPSLKALLFILVPAHVKVDVAMAMGLRSITWSSLNIHSFFHQVSATLKEFETFNKQVCTQPSD